MSNKPNALLVDTTIARIKAMEPGQCLTYSFSDMPDGVFFIYQQDLLPLAERCEEYERALHEIHALDDPNDAKSIAAAALDEVLGDIAIKRDTTELDHSSQWEDFDPLVLPDEDLVQNLTASPEGRESKSS